MEPLQTTETSMDRIEDRCDNIQKSPNDTRDYRGLILKNQLKVLLISDPETDESAAAMRVNVGNYIMEERISKVEDLKYGFL